MRLGPTRFCRLGVLWAPRAAYRLIASSVAILAQASRGDLFTFSRLAVAMQWPGVLDLSKEPETYDWRVRSAWRRQKQEQLRPERLALAQLVQPVRLVPAARSRSRNKIPRRSKTAEPAPTAEEPKAAEPAPAAFKRTPGSFTSGGPGNCCLGTFGSGDFPTLTDCTACWSMA